MPYPCTDDPSEILEYVSAAKSNASKFDTFVNGLPTQTVQLGTGDPTPTIRKFIADAQSVVATAANDAAETVLDDVADMKLNKADKFVPAEPGNLAELNSEGNLRDSGWAAEDFVPLLDYANSEAIELEWQMRTSMDVQAVKDGKADKFVPAEVGNLANLSADGNLRDAGRAIADFVPLLGYANGEAIELAWQNRMSIKLYREWIDKELIRLKHDMDEIAGANVSAMRVAQSIRCFIDVFDEAAAQHRLQIRLFNGTNPGASSKPVLFVICGQSNAMGSSDDGAFDNAKDCGHYWSWFDDANILKPIADPLWKPNFGGSGWCAFAKAFFALTGRKMILLNISWGGSAVTDGGYTTWTTWADNGYGTLRSGRTTTWNEFSASVPSTEYDVGAILWIQGETDSARVAAGTITVNDPENNLYDDYTQATLDVLGWLRTLIGSPACPVIGCVTGYNTNSMGTASTRSAYEAVQAAQKQIFNGTGGRYLACAMPPRFGYAQNAFMSDNLHYNAIGYEIVGKAFARTAANILSL